MPFFHPAAAVQRVARPPAGEDWVHEIKLDGYRMQLRAEGGGAVMRTRKGLDWTGKFSAIAEAAGLPDCIVDGEVVALDRNGAPDFAALQAALSEGRSRDLTYFVFDLLFAGGEDLRELPFSERKERLKTMLGRNGGPADQHQVCRAPGRAGRCGAQVRLHSQSRGHRFQRAGAPYRSGRTETWHKSRCRAARKS